MVEDQWSKYIRVRFTIPLKIITGAAIAALVNPDNIEVHRLIAHAVTYSFVACSFYVAGDLVFYLGKQIYRKYVNKEDETQ